MFIILIVKMNQINKKLWRTYIYAVILSFCYCDKEKGQIYEGWLTSINQDESFLTL